MNKLGCVVEWLLSWQIQCVWPKRRRGRKVFPAKVELRPGSHAYSAEVERGMQGRLCKEMMPDLGVDVEEVVF